MVGLCVWLRLTEDRKLIRIVLMKTNRDAGNCWTSLLENEYAADPWVQDQMQRKLTLERFQREATSRAVITPCTSCLCAEVMAVKAGQNCSAVQCRGNIDCRSAYGNTPEAFSVSFQEVIPSAACLRGLGEVEGGVAL